MNQSPQQRIEAVLNMVRPALQADGGDIKLVHYDEGLVEVRLTGACSNCPTSQITMTKLIKEKLMRFIARYCRRDRRSLMPGNSFGHQFRITTAGESHGAGNVVIIDGLPPGIKLETNDLLPDMARRKPGQSKLTTQRKEDDMPEILSGVFEGKTTGTPIAILVRNSDHRSHDYSNIEDKYRPGHADFSYDEKYGFRDYRGGGRSSARETVVRVAAGAVAKKLLAHFDVQILAYVSRIGHIQAQIDNPLNLSLEDIEAHPTRCPDPDAAVLMEKAIMEARKDLDSLGGIADIVVTGCPAGWGEPIFDRLKSDLAKAMFSIPAVVGVEFGAGFAAAAMKGSIHNDCFSLQEKNIITTTNNHGGILGGISTGMPILYRCAIKPTSSLAREQKTVTRDRKTAKIKTIGRHDPCLLPRFIPVAEAMTAITLADHLLRQAPIEWIKQKLD